MKQKGKMEVFQKSLCVRKEEIGEILLDDMASGAHLEIPRDSKLKV